MNTNIDTFLTTAFSLYFKQESAHKTLREIPLETEKFSLLAGKNMTWEEKVVLLIAIMPHIQPQSLDLFFIKNSEYDRPYTEFGGWKGTSHSGFLPTGETVAFLLAIDNPESRPLVMQLFSREHWFYKQNILWLDGQGEGEPFLSGKLCVSKEFVSNLLNDGFSRPYYSTDFPAKRMLTSLEWSDLILSQTLQEDIENISLWLKNENEICSSRNLGKYIKPGYRCLFYGPPGTGKTMTASLFGKRHGMDVYRINLSEILSKYIGESEKNIDKIFNQAENKNWILLFDEAEFLFGKRSEIKSSNDRFANQESYLSQKIEDFPGIIIFATTSKENIGDAFLRRFQSVLFFAMPDHEARLQLWTQIIPAEWLENDNLLKFASETELSGGSITNIILQCAIELCRSDKKVLTKEILIKALDKEKQKENAIK